MVYKILVLQMDLEELFQNDYEEAEVEPEYPVVEYRGLNIQLLNRHHSLWGDKLAECGKIAADIILDKKYGISVECKAVLELGAGSGLPSICSCIMNAKNVVTTDYPDDYLIDNIRYNLQNYENSHVVGYKWGNDPNPILELNNSKKFDILILSDVIFNVTVHRELAKSIELLMNQDGFALVLFTHHRTHNVVQEQNFFNVIKEFDLVWEEIDCVKHPPMFKDDLGDMELRTTAHIRIIRKQNF